jgi:hypothetical protein
MSPGRAGPREPIWACVIAERMLIETDDDVVVDHSMSVIDPLSGRPDPDDRSCPADVEVGSPEAELACR